MKGRRILAIRSGALGDTILAFPSLAALRSFAGPSGSLHFVGSEPAVRLARSPRHATSVEAFDRGRFRALFDPGAEAAELRAFLQPFEVVVAWSKLPHLRRFISRPNASLVEASPHPPENVHASDHLYRALAPLGILGETPHPEVVLDPAARIAARGFLESRGLRRREFVAIHPSSGSPRKNWPAEGFRAVAERARGERRGILWIEGEADSLAVPHLVRLLPAPVARNLALPVLAGVLAEASLYLGNDSGVTHLAAAVGAPTFALFGPTDSSHWAPRGPFVVVVDFRIEAGELWEKARAAFGAR